MGTLSNFGIPGVGILMPKVIYRFRVLIVEDGKVRENSKISSQAISISDLPAPTKVRKVAGTEGTYELDPGSITEDMLVLRLEDDLTNQMIREVYDLMGKKFTLAVQMLDGAETVVEEYSFQDATISEVNTSDLDYAGAPSPGRSFKLKFPSYLTSELPLHVEELQKWLGGCYFEDTGLNSNERSVVEKVVFINYVRVFHTFFDPQPAAQNE